MPELPEVECIRRSLEPLIAGRVVLEARLFRRDVLVAPGDPIGGFARQRARAVRPKRTTEADLLAGATIDRIDRRGKQLAIIARAGTPEPLCIALGVQLGMTGGLRFARSVPHRPGQHTHAVWRFEHGTLVFRDPRRFGGLRVFRSLDALHGHWRLLGPDALTLSAAELVSACAGSHRAIKSVLMDQASVAGIGNIYADESLFRAGIHPARRSSALHGDSAARLAGVIRAVLREAVAAGGTTLQDYADAKGQPGAYQTSHAAYGRAGLPCTLCSTPLKSTTLAQRTTVWCPSCQPYRATPPHTGQRSAARLFTRETARPQAAVVGWRVNEVCR